MSKENDILHASAVNPGEVSTFTENDLLKKLGLTRINPKELEDLIEPNHLYFIT